LQLDAKIPMLGANHKHVPMKPKNLNFCTQLQPTETVPKIKCLQQICIPTCSPDPCAQNAVKIFTLAPKLGPAERFEMLFQLFGCFWRHFVALFGHEKNLRSALAPPKYIFFPKSFGFRKPRPSAFKQKKIEKIGARRK